MSTIASVLAAAADVLAEAGVESARLDAEVLLASALGISRTALFARLGDACAPPALFAEFLQRRQQREPLAYIVGGREFWSLWFEVSRATLVPRPETEMLVEAALEAIGTLDDARVLEIGTGSGCIAVAIARESRATHLAAIDCSPEALAVAERNAVRHGVADRVEFLLADARDYAASQPFDVLVANLPYVRRDDIDALEPEVSRWEPRRALDGGDDGLDLVRAVLGRARAWLAPGGALAIEIGHDQADGVIQLCRDAGFDGLRVRADHAGLSRVIAGRLRQTATRDERRPTTDPLAGEAPR